MKMQTEFQRATTNFNIGVQEVIIAARKPSTRASYACKMASFLSWAYSRGINPLACEWEGYRRSLLYLSNLFLVTGYIALLFYALIWEAGIIVSLPTKRIGFYNICLWNEEAEELDCLLFKDLEKMGINKVALVLSRICVYSTPVLCLYVATTILQALCLKDKDGWKLACTLLAVSALSLPAGLSLFLFQTERWVQISELGGVFVALAGAHALLLLHMITIGTYLARLKDARPPGQFFPVKSIP